MIRPTQRARGRRYARRAQDLRGRARPAAGACARSGAGAAADGTTVGRPGTRAATVPGSSVAVGPGMEGWPVYGRLRRGRRSRSPGSETAGPVGVPVGRARFVTGAWLGGAFAGAVDAGPCAGAGAPDPPVPCSTSSPRTPSSTTIPMTPIRAADRRRSPSWRTTSISVSVGGSCCARKPPTVAVPANGTTPPDEAVRAAAAKAAASGNRSAGSLASAPHDQMCAPRAARPAAAAAAGRRRAAGRSPARCRRQRAGGRRGSGSRRRRARRCRWPARPDARTPAPAPCRGRCRAPGRRSWPRSTVGDRATPKSTSTTVPSGRTSRLAGFTSRCTIPCAWAACSASAACARIDRVSGTGSRCRSWRSGSTAAGRRRAPSPGTRPVAAGYRAVTVVVDVHHVRMVQGGHRAGLRAEPRVEAGIGQQRAAAAP